MKRAVVMSIAVAALAVTPVSSQAASFSIAPDARGFRSATAAGPISADSTYFVGNTLTLGDSRNFFQFRLPTFTGKVISARLRLNTGVAIFDQQPAMTYQFTSLAELPDSPADTSLLGTGTLYGSRSFTIADAGTPVSIEFNTAGISAITSGSTFRIGGRLVDVEVDSTPAFGLFSATIGSSVSLEFDTAVPAVPEPASWAMLITGFGLAGVALRRRRRAIA